MTLRVHKTDTDARRRRIFVSDVHGNLCALRALLAQLDCGEDDELYFLGDLVERGEDSLATLRFVMDLCRRGRAQAVRGNCDTLWANVLPQGARHASLLSYMRWRKHSLFWDMARELDYPVGPHTDPAPMCARFLQSFAPELQFLDSLPHIIESGDFLLAHAGLDDIPLARQDPERSQRRSNFLLHAPAFDRLLVVGHYPVQNYHRRISRGTPIHDRQRNIASIDGGNAVKAEGQLNALVLQGSELCFYRADGFAPARVTGAQAASDDPIHITWPWRTVQVLRAGPKRSLCRHLDSGRDLMIPNRCITRYQGECQADYTDYYLPLAPGDVVGIIEAMDQEVAFVKHGDVAGLAHRSLLECGGPAPSPAGPFAPLDYRALQQEDFAP